MWDGAVRDLFLLELKCVNYREKEGVDAIIVVVFIQNVLHLPKKKGAPITRMEKEKKSELSWHQKKKRRRRKRERDRLRLRKSLDKGGIKVGEPTVSQIMGGTIYLKM